MACTARRAIFLLILKIYETVTMLNDKIKELGDIEHIIAPNRDKSNSGFEIAII